CIACGYFPARYKESNVIVLRKAGKSLEVLRTPRGYRPISLLNTVGKRGSVSLLMLDITGAFNYLTALIRSYFTSRSSRLKVDGRLSEPFDIERGSELLYFTRARIANTSILTLDGSVIVPTQEARMLSRGRDCRVPIPPLPPYERLETPALRPRPPEGLGQPYSST
ncbi:hypothetical protein L249_5967, partial [Ophiocordyceps polyrhachis-furcata BCC 54312]